MATGRAERDCTADLRGALPPVTGGHFAAITEPAKIGELLRAIDGYGGQPSTAYALRLAPHVFVRPGGQLRQATWSEFNLNAGEWRIAGKRMKAGEPHAVPLSRQAFALLRMLQSITGTAAICSRRFAAPRVRLATTPSMPRCVGSAIQAKR